MIRPFTKDDWPKFLGKAFTMRNPRNKIEEVIFTIGWARHDACGQAEQWVAYETFARDYVFAQTGKPAGIEVEG